MRDHAPYPKAAERASFYRSYIETSKGRPARDDELRELDRGVEVWRPAGSASWAIWGVVSAEAQVDALERGDGDWSPEWEYLVRSGPEAASHPSPPSPSLPPIRLPARRPWPSR